MIRATWIRRCSSSWLCSVSRLDRRPSVRWYSIAPARSTTFGSAMSVRIRRFDTFLLKITPSKSSESSGSPFAIRLTLMNWLGSISSAVMAGSARRSAAW